jgi:Lon protease-like protein
MAELLALEQSLANMPLFPLPSAILLPYEMVPLHVFEPRYRAMVRDVLEDGRPIGIAQLAPGWEGDYEGRPRVEPVFGAGHVVRHERLADGRYNILVRGIGRVRLVEELGPDKPYREARVERVADAVRAGADVHALAESMTRMIFALCSSRPGPGASALAELAARAKAPGDLADVVIAALVTDASQRRRSLTDADVVQRVETAQAAIAELLIGGVPSSEVRYRN